MVSAITPTMFFLFILSHGDADGKIHTDYPNQNDKRSFETFSVNSVFEALKDNALLKDTLKLVFLGVSAILFSSLNINK